MTSTSGGCHSHQEAVALDLSLDENEGYRGLAAAILLNALSNYSCKNASCEKVTTNAGRKYPAVRRAICVNCQRDAEGFLYSDWCHALLEMLNLDQGLLIQAMDNPESTAKLHKMKAKHAPDLVGGRAKENKP